MQGVHSVIESPIRNHSQKPDEAREKIVDLLGDIPRIELFAREKIDGWDSWGNEIESDVDLFYNKQKTIDKKNGNIRNTKLQKHKVC